MKVRGSLSCSDHEVAEVRILRGANRAKQDHSPGLHENTLPPLQRSAWKNPMGYNSGEKRGPVGLAANQRSSPLSSRKASPYK